MIKGVNKRIIEINEYESKMFEKAILFLKPSAQNVKDINIKIEAKKYLQDLEKNKNNIDITKNKRKRLLIKNRIVFCILGALISTAFFVFINLII